MVRSLHPTTIEVTTEGHLTPRGDCIIGVSASSGCAELDERLKDAIRRRGSRVALKIVVGSEAFSIWAQGSPGLQLSDEHDIVVRKSDFVSDRTLAVRASAAAADIPRTIVSRLRDPDSAGSLRIEVFGPGPE